MKYNINKSFFFITLSLISILSHMIKFFSLLVIIYEKITYIHRNIFLLLFFALFSEIF